MFFLNSFLLINLQIQSKASTLSSGARAAAQTLNVPIERLEAQVHMTQNNKIQAINDKHIHNHRDRDRIDSHDDDHIEYNQHHQNGKSTSPNHNNYLQQQQQHQQGNHHANNHKNSINNGHYSQQDDIVMHNQDDDHPMMDSSPSVMKYSLLQFAIQHFRNE